MKREFGSKLIEDFLAHQDLRLVADTSGAYIPGHGTPTVIIVGRNDAPEAPTVRAVLGVRGEPGRPDDPAKGIVWTSISEHVDDPGWDDGWITVADLDRTLLATHPWSLSGGGAVDLMSAVTVDMPRESLIDVVVRKLDCERFTEPTTAFICISVRRRIAAAHGSQFVRAVITGDVVRDWLVRAWRIRRSSL